MRRTIPLGLLLMTGVAWCADWPAFRGPGGCATSEETGLPLRWSASDGGRWKAPLPGQGLSGPVVVGDRVYLTACSGYRQTRLHVLCFDAATGRPRWQRQLIATGNTACNPETNMAAATPTADAMGVCALFGSGDLAAFDPDGRPLWYRSLAADYPNVTNQVGMASSPLLAGDVLLVPLDSAGDSFFAGVDRRTGVNRWKVRRQREINWSTPIVVSWQGCLAALVQSPTELTAYEVASGKVLWQYRGTGLSAIKSPTAGDGRVFVAGEKLIALRPEGSGSAPVEEWQSGTPAQGYASPVYHQGHIYYLTPVALVCLDAASGAERGRQRVDGPFDASPLIAAGRLYVVNNRGRTTVLQLGARPKVLARNDLDDRLQASPAAAQGCLFFRSEKYLYCVGSGR